MNKRGFTLVELLVTIVIVGLLSTLAYVAINSARLKACSSGDKEVCISMGVTPSEARIKLAELDGDDSDEMIDPEFLDRLDKELIGSSVMRSDSSSVPVPIDNIDHWGEGIWISRGENVYKVTRVKERMHEMVIEFEKIEN